jgi:phthiocerol/phenolphthiocerol synthesis type-I polyketide synthase E
MRKMPLKPAQAASLPNAAHSLPSGEGVAIIGMSARFPRSRNVGEFWTRLLAGESLISTFTEEELREAGVDPGMLASRDYVRRGSVLEDADRFDASFFNINRREAEILDPQHRIFLECAWEALEHAGYTGDGARVGVYAGVGMNTYILQLLSNPALLANSGGYQLMLGNDKDFIATRVSYKMNLHGPAVVVQTACSTSLAAVHLACRGILEGECEMALAGGVAIPFPQGIGYPYIPGMILSPDGVCRPFDKEAKGTVPGRGAGIVVLKRLSQAVADNDRIYAVIRGSAWNNDGAGKVGYTAPSVEGQAEVIRSAQRAAGVSANRIGYVETHGTGTELGDPIEVAALTEVFQEGEAKVGSCVLGALKANMGHADVAAGIAGLIKASLAIHEGVIPPTPTFRQANPSLALEKGPFFVSASKISWPEGERWAGVSAFGIGGTNVHVVLSGAPERDSDRTSPADEKARIFPVSARTPAALNKVREQLAAYLESDPAVDLAAVASTLQLGRRAFEHRSVVVAKDAIELQSKLREPGKAVAPDAALAREAVFLFPGQGQQFIGMAAGLYRADPSFRNTVDRGAELIQDEFGIELLSILTGAGKTPELQERMKQTGVAQPLLFLTEYALAARWRALGVEPAALLGHSLGELVAATVAGVFSFEDGLRLAAERGHLMAQAPPGVMLAVTLQPDALARYFVEDLWLAAENGPRLSVASGLPSAIEELERKLSAARIPAVRLSSNIAFHTPLMADAAKAFREKVDAVQRKAPTIPWLSNVTGTWIQSSEAQSPQYWATQILARVRFAKNIAVLAERPRLLLEVGPGEALIGMARQQMAKSFAVASLGAENRRQGDELIFLDAAARLWQAGVNLRWREFDPAQDVRRIPLPTYPFEREKYWIEAAAPTPAAPASAPAASGEVLGEGKRAEISSWFYAPNWQSTPPAGMSTGQTGKKIDCWLVLLDRSGLGAAVVERLEQSGAAVISVSAGEGFAQNGKRFSVDPGERGDYERMWREIAELDLQPQGLIDLWTMRGTGVSPFDTLVLLLQTGRAKRQRLSQIEIVTDSLEQIMNEPVQEVERAEIFGLARVISAEYSDTQCRTIDIDLVAADLERSVEQILSELDTPSGLSIAYRGTTRWQKGWMPAPLPPQPAVPFKSGGVYLITGGAGGIGFSIASHLLRTFQARVVLTSRTGLPGRDEWEAWLAEHAENDTLSRRIRRMEELEKLGGEVVLLRADVADRQAMDAAMGEIRKRFGKIDGVVHAAGLPGGGMVAGLDLAEAAEIRRPKVQGTVVLAQLLAELPEKDDLAFFLLCSSISAILPAPGQAAYAAANAFQNYFAVECRERYGLPAVAIDFDAWQEVGMIADMVLPEGFDEIKDARLRTAMSTAEGMDVIQRVLGGWSGPQILTSTVRFQPEFAKTSSRDSLPERETVLPSGGEDHAAAIVEIWRDLLGEGDIGPADNFFELGGHSLLGTMVLSRIRERFGVVLTLKALFEAPTPQTLAEKVRTSPPEEPGPVPVAAGEREEFEI